MFGYVKPDLPYLYMKDSVLYRAMYCGLCAGIGKCAGHRARACLNYDMSFFSALVHNIAGEDVNISAKRCIIHWFIPRPIAAPDALTEKVAALNVIMAYCKLTDDVIDSGKGRIKRSYFKKGYRRAQARFPELDAIVKKRYEDLLELEKSGCDSLDRIADPFGKMLEECGAELVGEKAGESERTLFYHIGKWVYLIDALDDFDRDGKSGEYNPFRLAYPEAADKDELFARCGEEIKYVFESVFSCIREKLKEVRFHFNHDLTDNILLRGMPLKTTSIINKECKKCKKNSIGF